ncbi:hypothetical protein, partial [Stenotrophomonas maltophilia]|uniref:hypothetical protein n=1 Tax=Stenotrophomonas maltophilia TaxID=40324 RepID=UPI0039C0E4ED
MVDTSVRYRYIKWGQIRFPQENGSDPKRPSGRSQETVEGGVGQVVGVSAAWSVFPLTMLQPCQVDSWVEWAD